MDQTAKPKSSLFLRVASGVVLAPLVIACIIWGGIPFGIFAGVAMLLSVAEWLGLVQKSNRPVFDGFYGIIYLFLCFAAFASLRYHYVDGAGLVLCLVLAVWATDIGAYFSGKAIGGPKMAPVISPNKTWAGLIGGVLASMAVLVIYKLYATPLLALKGYFDLAVFASIDVWKVAAIGAALAVIGQIGDLFVSMEKRKCAVKDTGHLIPGHGGILDRIDSLLLAAPAFILLLKVAQL